MEVKKIVKITFEYEDGSKEMVSGVSALLMQSRINSSGILSGIEVENDKG